MLKRLAQKGQLRRTRHPDDGRSYVLELTRAGKATNARNVKRFALVMARLRANLGIPPDEVLEPMRRLEDALRTTLAEGQRFGSGKENGAKGRRFRLGVGRWVAQLSARPPPRL